MKRSTHPTQKSPCANVAGATIQISVHQWLSICTAFYILFCTALLLVLFAYSPAIFSVTAFAAERSSAKQVPYLQQDDDTHTIRPGETLNKIAGDYGVLASELMRLNSILDSDAIYVGQILKLPELPTDETDTDDTGEAATEEKNGDSSNIEGVETDEEVSDDPLLPDITYTVQRGETLSEIAKAYSVTMDDLMLLNGISNADALYAGQVLYLPPDAVDQVVDQTTIKEVPAESAESGSEEDEVVSPIVSPKDADSDVAFDTEATDAEIDAELATQEPADQEESAPSTEATEETEETTEPTAEPSAEYLSSIELLSNAPDGLTTSLNRVYTVRTGDTIIRIALRAGVDLEALRQLNGLTVENDDRISVGQQLILPATAGELFVERETDGDSSGETYEVQPGDSIGAIAQAYALSIADLLAANRIIDPNAIYVGQSLDIPSSTEDEQSSEQTITVGPGRNGFYYYTVGPGDTLGKISQQFDTTAQALVAYNGLPNLETAYLGLELRIPFGPPTQPIDRPRTPPSGTSFLVSLSRQECWVYRGNKVYKQWTCSTGYGEWTTKKGTFAIKTMQELAKSSAHRLDMPYWLGIYDVGNFENGIHGLPTRWSDGQKIWTGLIGQPATFGCAMLTDDNAEQLFSLAFLGMPVHVID